MNARYFLNGFLAVFGLFSISELMQKQNQHSPNKIASYWKEVGAVFKTVFDEQTKKLHRE